MVPSRGRGAGQWQRRLALAMLCHGLGFMLHLAEHRVQAW